MAIFHFDGAEVKIDGGTLLVTPDLFTAENDSHIAINGLGGDPFSCRAVGCKVSFTDLDLTRLQGTVNTGARGGITNLWEFEDCDDLRVSGIKVHAPDNTAGGNWNALIALISSVRARIDDIHVTEDALGNPAEINYIIDLDANSTGATIHRVTSTGAESIGLYNDDAADTEYLDHGAGGASELDDLTDVDAASPNDDDLLQWNASTSQWEAVAVSGGSPHDHDADYADIAHTHAIDDLSDVDAPTPSANDVLVWNDGTNQWEPAAQSGGGASELDDLTDVDLTTAAPADGQVLVFDDGTSTWIPETVVGAGSDLDDINDVDAAAPDDGDVLTFDSGTGNWVPEAPAVGGGGGGGDVPPSSPHADNDEFTDSDGTNPSTTGWTWQNQSGFTAEIRAGRLVFNFAGSTTRNFHGLFKAFPAGTDDKTVVAKVGGNYAVNHHGVGVALVWGTLATPTRIDVIYIRADHQTPDWNTYTGWAFAGAAARTAGGTNGPGFDSAAMGFHYVHSGTTIRGIISRDPHTGHDFTYWGTAVNPASARPDFYGIVASDQTAAPAGNPVKTWAEYFRVDWATL